MTVGLPFDVAHEITSKNKTRIFTKTTGNGKSGFERAFGLDFPEIAVQPKFKLSRNSRFFTIGSCFARNIEGVLSSMGIECISSKCVIPGEFYEQAGIGARNGALNTYTPHSMREFVNISSRPDKTEIGLLQTGEDEWCDMLVSGIKFLPREQINYIRGMILRTYEELSEADTVVLTLGFTEAWFDNQDQIFVNRSPGASIKTIKRGQRYSFCNGTPQEVADIVDNTVRDLHKITHGRAKIILTTSPVPLHGTFTGRDVISANLYSKSTLLSAAVSVSAKYDFVDYYPSYEMVIYSKQANTWLDDGVHVNPARVEKVIQTFADAYFF